MIQKIKNNMFDYKENWENTVFWNKGNASLYASTNKFQTKFYVIRLIIGVIRTYVEFNVPLLCKPQG